MKFILSTIAVSFLLTVSAAYAEPFSPTLLKLCAEPEVKYVFDGSPFELPFTVEGTPAGVLFLVYTKDKAQDIGIVENGYLGWHWVNKVDTCIYYSTLKSVLPGNHVYEWDGRDQDGGIVEPGEYTYYLWAFDNQSEKQIVGESLYSGWGFANCARILETDEYGLTRANPLWYTRDTHWEIGSNPHDPKGLITCNIKSLSTDKWMFHISPVCDPQDHNMFYLVIRNDEYIQTSMRKLRFVPGGVAEIQEDWGESDGFASVIETKSTVMPGPVTDGNYLYLADNNIEQYTNLHDKPYARFHIYSLDGIKLNSVDIQSWWTSSSDYEKGGSLNGGPQNITERNGKVFINSISSCLNQMLDPVRYLDTGIYEDLFVWSNGNGDYVLDKNFEETSTRPWVCNDFDVSPYIYSISSDATMFCSVVAFNSMTKHSIGLLGPDGTGLGYYSFSGETAGWKKGVKIIDSGSSFDGIYSDNESTTNFKMSSDYNSTHYGIFFLGHDSISGVISSSGVSVDSGNENPVPAAFTLSQNSPNPFNPSTSIPFTLPKDGHVTLTVYDITGRTVSTLVDGAFAAGSHEIVWDATGMASGVYICRLEASGKVKTVKMTLAK